jgi:hypothetical protein
MKTVAVFESTAFNHSEPQEYFINPCCFGDDLAKWLMGELAQRGVRVDDEPGQEDFGWYFEYSVNEERYCLVISSDGEGEWYLVLERACGMLASLFGGRHRNVGSGGLDVVREILEQLDKVENLRWLPWKQFRQGGVLAG